VTEVAGERRLGLFSATALVVASMVGTGVFTTSGLLLADLGRPGPVLLAWLLGGVLATCGALSYGALARRLPESGGEYLFLSRTLHPAAGNIAGWISLLVGFSAPLAAAAYGFGEYLKHWFPASAPQWPATWLLCGFALIHGWDARKGAWLQNFTVVLKIALMVAFIGFALPRLPQQPPVAAAPGGAGSFALALVWVSFSYSGWNAAVYVAGEVRDPRRNLPLALLLGTGLVTLLYLALNATLLAAAAPAELAGKIEVARLAALALGGPAWADAVSVLVALALATTVSAMMMAGPRVYAQMARDGCLPAWLAGGAGAPAAAVALQWGVSLLLLWTAAFDSLLTYIGFTLSLSSAATVIGLIRLKRREGGDFAVPGWPWVPGLFLLGVIWMALAMVLRQPVESLWGLASCGIGWVSWRWSRWRRNGRWERSKGG
jgi:APA family basic amino acid/polyamine antiporter